MIDQKALEHLILNPNDPSSLFILGSKYEEIDQTSSAIGYYLKCAELSDDDKMTYIALLRIAICYTRQGGRNAHVISNLQWAIDLLPERVEAYYLISIAYEQQGDWKNSMLFARLGLDKKITKETISMICGLHSQYQLEFQYAHTSWWCGRYRQANKIFKELHLRDDIEEPYKSLIENNITK